MAPEDFVDWLMWGIIFLCCAVSVWLFVFTIVDIIRSRLRRPNDDGNNRLSHEYDMMIEKLLRRPKNDDSEEKQQCVICLSEEENNGDGGGERGRWAMLPGCAHAFHKDCVVKWLRNSKTCPLCRSTVAVAAADDTISAADNMV